MSYLRQSTNGSRRMAFLAKSRAKEEGKPCYLIYDCLDKSYYACSFPDEGYWKDSEHVIKRFLPDGTSEEIDNNDVPRIPEPEFTRNEELMEEMIKELEER